MDAKKQPQARESLQTRAPYLRARANAKALRILIYKRGPLKHARPAEPTTSLCDTRVDRRRIRRIVIYRLEAEACSAAERNVSQIYVTTKSPPRSRNMVTVGTLDADDVGAIDVDDIVTAEDEAVIAGAPARSS